MVNIKMTTSLYHSKIGNVNIGQTLNVDSEVADMLVKNNMAKIIEQKEKEVTVPTKKKTAKKGD